MADHFILLIPIEHIINKYYELKKFTSKIQKKASSVGFLNQSLYHNFILTFAKIKGLFNSAKNKHHAERKMIKRHLANHHGNFKSLRNKHEELISYLLQILGKSIFRILLHNIAKSLRMNNL